MKNSFSALFLLSFLLFGITSFGSRKNDNKNGEQNTAQLLTVVCSPDLYDLSSDWVSTFGNLYPGQKLTLSCQTEGNPLADGVLYLTADGSSDVQIDKSSWKMLIGHDLVVPVFNSKNPLIGEINKKGFTPEDFARLLSGNSNWKMIFEGAPETPIHFYISDNQSLLTKIAGFTKTEEATFHASKINSAEELISLIQKDIYALGFCKLTDVLNHEKNAFTKQIGIIPVDKNRNGRIDSFENIYSTPESLTRSAWIGKYPRELCGEIYALATVKPSSQTALDFMAYVNSEGQDFIKKSGFSVLSSVEKKANLIVLTNRAQQSEPGGKSQFTSYSRILIIGSTILIVFFLFLLLFKRQKTSGIDSDDIEITPALNENSILAPKGLYYDKTHTWAFMEQDGLVKIGVDDFLKQVAGPFTQLKMKEPGEKIRKGEKILTIIRNGKQLNLHSPVSGFIRKQNTFLVDTPLKINILPYADSWVYQIEPSNWKRETSFMFMFDKYRDWLEDEFTRLKDFLAMSANTNAAVYEHIVLQDGGELKNNVLADLDPKVWEDFQTKFIDTSK